MKKNNIWIGLLFILAAVYVGLQAAGIDFGMAIWQIVIAVFSVCVIISAISSRNPIGCIIPLGFLVWIFRDKIGLASVTGATIIAISILLTIGLSIMFSGVRSNKAYAQGNLGTKNFGPVENVTGEQHAFHVNFGSASRRVETDNFIGASMKVNFGAMKLFLNDAIIQNADAYLNLEVAFGGAEIYVPANWRVINQANAFAGGLDEKGRMDSNPSKNLVVTGNISFGGVQIYYV